MTIDRDLVADEIARMKEYNEKEVEYRTCLLYTSDAADDWLVV